MVASAEIADCEFSTSVFHGSFYSFDSKRWSGCGPSDENTEYNFQIEGFWKFCSLDNFELPDFDSAFNSNYEDSNGLNLFAAYMWMFFVFIGLIAYVILQFFATKGSITSIISDVIMILVAVASLFEYYAWKGVYDVYDYFDDYYYVPVMTIVCGILGIYGLVVSITHEEE